MYSFSTPKVPFKKAMLDEQYSPSEHDLHLDKKLTQLEPIPHYFNLSDSAIIQPKLTISNPNDKYEQEADRMADLVVNQLSNLPSNQDDTTKYSSITKNQHTIYRKKQFSPLVNLVELTNASLVLQRKEREQNTPEEDLEHGDWRANDRVYETVIWQRANVFNLDASNHGAYAQPHERRDFYLWFYNYTSDLGFETKWPLAAYLVAGGAARLAYGSFFTNKLQVAARKGNQIIFDDVFPKLQRLLNGGPLKGKDAIEWDAKTLSEEQHLIQAMYEDMDQDTINEFTNNAKQESILAIAGRMAGFVAPHRGGRFHRTQNIPAFEGDIMSVEDRFNYGMRLANEFSIHPHHGNVNLPAPREAYTNGQAFINLNVLNGLHELDAELDDFDVDEKEVIRIIQGLTQLEQLEIGNNDLRLQMMANALNADELEQALSGRNHIHSWVKEKLRTLL